MNQAFPSEEFLARWLDGTLSETERRAWEASDHYKELQPVMGATAQLSVPATRSRAAAWQTLQARMQAAAPGAEVRPAPRRWLWASVSVAVAAAVALLVFVFYPLAEPLQFRTGPGEQLTVNLPAGSSVQLNALSSLSYAPEAWIQRRVLSLEGEAYFDVTPGQPFVVHTPQGKVSVLGTTFNVRVRPDGAEVRCLSGKVEVEAVQEQVLLVAGEGILWDENGQIRTFTHQTDSPDWISGLFRFREAPLSQVLAELQRQYGVEVEIPAEATARTYTGAFRHGNLESALHNICDPLGLSFKVEDQGTVRIFSRLNQ